MQRDRLPPIDVPADFQPGDRIDDPQFRRKLNQILAALRRIRDAKPKEEWNFLDTRHPWKISVRDVGSTWTATVGEGDILYADLHDDSNDDAQWCTARIAVSKTDLTGLTDSTTYGIWLKAAVDYSIPINNDVDSSASIKTAVNYQINSVTVVTNTTYTTAGGLGGITASTSGFAYCYVGQVAITAGGAVTVTQALRHHFTWQPPTALLPYIVSEDSGNLITAGTDSGAWIDAAAMQSGDSNNKIKLGTDSLLAFYLIDGDGSTLAGANTQANPYQVDVP